MIDPENQATKDNITFWDQQEEAHLKQLEIQLESVLKAYQPDTSASSSSPECSLWNQADQAITTIISHVPSLSKLLKTVMSCYCEVYDSYKHQLEKLTAEKDQRSAERDTMKSWIEELEKDLMSMRSKKDDNEIKLQLQSEKVDDLQRMVDLMKTASKDHQQENVVKEIKSLLEENEKLKMNLKEVKEEVDYQKQRENKLMYFLYVM